MACWQCPACPARSLLPLPPAKAILILTRGIAVFLLRRVARRTIQKGKDFVDDDTMEPDGNVSPPRKGSDGAGRGGANPLMEDRQRVLGQEEAASSHIHDPWTAEHFELCSMSPVRRVFKALRLQESCGFITLVKYSQPPGDSVPCADGTGKTTGEWVLFDVSFGIPLFDARVNRCLCCYANTMLVDDMANFVK